MPRRALRNDPFDTTARPALPDKSLYMQRTIRLLPEEKNWVVYVEPRVARFNVGMPLLEPITTTRLARRRG